jgi:hypothetical protein
MKRLTLFSLILGTALALVPIASSMVLSDGGGGSGAVAAAPGGIDPATQAVLLRGKALAQYYDTGAVVSSPANIPLTGKALGAFYDTGAMVTSGSAQPTSSATSKPVDPATQAVLLRSKGLADYYGANGVTFHTDVLGGNGGSSAAPTAAGDSFDWSPVLAATLAGMLLLAAAATIVTRRKQHLSY